MRLHHTIPLAQALAQCGKADIELAFEVGVNTTTIWRWRTGRSIPASQATREALACGLGRKIDEIAWPEREQEAA